LRIRDVTATDVAAVTDIYAHHVRHGTGTFELVPPAITEMASRITAVIEAQLPFLVAEYDDGAIVGFAYAGPYRPRPAYQRTVEDSIYLSPDAFGRGVGTQLLNALLHRCEAWGARQVIAVIGDSANVASVRLHEKCGFAVVGTFRAVGWKHNRWLDTVLMQRSLGLGSDPERP
jgi:phosphinothricin acetyltransferase